MSMLLRTGSKIYGTILFAFTSAFAACMEEHATDSTYCNLTSQYQSQTRMSVYTVCSTAVYAYIAQEYSQFSLLFTTHSDPNHNRPNAFMLCGMYEQVTSSLPNSCGQAKPLLVHVKNSIDIIYSLSLSGSCFWRHSHSE